MIELLVNLVQYNQNQSADMVDVMISDAPEKRKTESANTYSDEDVPRESKSFKRDYDKIMTIIEKYYVAQNNYEEFLKLRAFVKKNLQEEKVKKELIVNAVTHRAYSITGTDIQIKMFDDHIVVESPGRLPGLVRADNIRFTHFSRNPKIAEFLKNYKFVKEFGEGVNRMCNELEQVGLKDPVYHTNAFMLQAVIYNLKVGKTIIEKTADSLKKLAVAVNKSLIDYQKPAIGEEKSAIDDKKSAVDRIKSAIEQQKYNEPSKANILKVYDEIEKNQIFGTKEIKEILDCSPSTARAVMIKLRDMKVVKAVNGKGKGKYVFIE